MICRLFCAEQSHYLFASHRPVQKLIELKITRNTNKSLQQIFQSKSGNIAAFRPYKHFIVLETEFVDSRGEHRVYGRYKYHCHKRDKS